jgi:hypothetical protein
LCSMWKAMGCRTPTAAMLSGECSTTCTRRMTCQSEDSRQTGELRPTCSSLQLCSQRVRVHLCICVSV